MGIVKRAGEFKGTGRRSQVLTDKEEERLKAHILYKAEIGYGESWKTLQTILQLVLLEIKKTDPERITGFEEQGQRPNISWVRRFAARNNISLRKCSVISKGRAVISPKDIALWFQDVGSYLNSHPALLEALQDPQRVFNQDETAIEHGVGDQFVLAGKGDKQTYAVSSSTREHTTISFTVSAAGGVVEPHVVFPGAQHENKMLLLFILSGQGHIS